MCYSGGAGQLGNQARLGSRLENLSPDVVYELFVPHNASETHAFASCSQPATRADVLQPGLGVGGWPRVLPHLKEPQRLSWIFPSLPQKCFYLLCPCIIVFLTSWKEMNTH